MTETTGMAERMFRKITFTGKTAAGMRRLIPGGRLIDALMHFPLRFVDRTYSPKLSDLMPGRVATVRAMVISIATGTRGAPTDRKSVV
jgi:hypothetical protein